MAKLPLRRLRNHRVQSFSRCSSRVCHAQWYRCVFVFNIYNDLDTASYFSGTGFDSWAEIGTSCFCVFFWPLPTSSAPWFSWPNYGPCRQWRLFWSQNSSGRWLSSLLLVRLLTFCSHFLWASTCGAFETLDLNSNGEDPLFWIKIALILMIYRTRRTLDTLLLWTVGKSSYHFVFPDGPISFVPRNSSSHKVSHDRSFSGLFTWLSSEFRCYNTACPSKAHMYIYVTAYFASPVSCAHRPWVLCLNHPQNYFPIVFL